MLYRTCKACQVEKRTDEFHWWKGKPRSKCIDCYRAEQRVFSREYNRRKRAAAKKELEAKKQEELTAVQTLTARVDALEKRIEELLTQYLLS